MEENQLQGKQKFIWDAKAYPKGIYYFQFRSDNQFALGKLIKLK